MATVEKYQTPSGATLYMVHYRTPGRGQTKKRGFKTKRDAERWANKTEVEKLRGEYIPPSLGRITVGELAPDWLASKKQAIAPSHYRTLESARARRSQSLPGSTSWRCNACSGTRQQR
jgi:hypothetical protein